MTLRAHILLTVFIACGFAVLPRAIAADQRTSQSVAKPKIVTTQEWGSKPQPIPDSRKQTPQYITIHHAGELWVGKKAPAQYVRDMQSWGQREKHWPDLPYHFLIAPDGQIFEGRQIQYEPDSNTKYELQGNVNVEMMGNFEAQRPSPEQIRSCVKLVAWLCQDLNINADHVRGHRDAAKGQTDCPGRDFYRYLQDGQFKQWLSEALNGRDPEIVPGPPLPKGPTTQITLTAPPASASTTQEAK